MKYCTNCGRQLADDEVCTCRQQAQPQAPNQTQDNNAPVSYTHLDVYKRQSLR